MAKKIEKFNGKLEKELQKGAAENSEPLRGIITATPSGKMGQEINTKSKKEKEIK